jgi:hypothetical protein
LTQKLQIIISDTSVLKLIRSSLKNGSISALVDSISAATVAALLGQDTWTAAFTATNAVENNAILMAVGAGLAIYEVYEIYQTYKKEGAKAALQKVAIDGTITREHLYYPLRKKVCIPPKVTLGQMIKIFINWGSNHPEFLHLPALEGVNSSVAEAFPCQKVGEGPK